jgi:hypothetical protein
MPIFENQQHRDNQDRCQWLLEYMGYEVIQTPTLAHVDFALKLNGRPHALVEYKCRDEQLRFPYYIDKTKVDNLINLSFDKGVRPILIISGPNPPYHWAHPHKNYPTKDFLRTKNGKDRGETPDTVYQIPKDEFSII